MTKRTPEQQIAYYQEKIHKIKAEQAKRARNERTRRLCAGGGLIEKLTGLELTEENARAIAQTYINSQKNSPREAHIEQQLPASATNERQQAPQSRYAREQAQREAYQSLFDGSQGYYS